MALCGAVLGGKVAIAPRQGGEGKRFFFAKKNQTLGVRHIESRQKFFGPFSQKRTASFLTIALCTLVAFFEGIDIQAPGVTAPKLTAALHLSPGQLGWFFSIGTCGLLLGAATGGWLADRLGRKRVLMLSVCIFGLFTVATAAANSYPMLIAMRGLTGLGLGGAFPNLLALCSENAPPERRRMAVAAMYAGLPAGGTLACLVALLLPPSAGWQGLFLIGGIAPLTALPLLFRYLPESTAFTTRISAATVPVGEVLFQAARARPTALLWVSFLGTMLVFYLLLNWLPSLLIGSGLRRHDASVVQLFFNLAGALGVLAAGTALDGQHRLRVALFAYLGSGAALLLLALTPTLLLTAIAFGSLAGAATMATQSVLYAAAPPFYPTRMRGTGVGAAVAVGRIGSITGPVLAGVLVGRGHSAGQVLLAVLPILAISGLGACLLVGRRVTDA